jgi:hypothetical protein
VFVTDERVDVDVHGAAKEGIDPGPLIDHYTKRTLIGMGVSGVDLGVTDTANKSTADNVSQNLKESVKADTDWLCDQIKYYVFLDLFAESPTQLSVQRAVADVSLEFHEIDTDTQIKKQNHAMESFNNNALTHTEMRQAFKKKPMDKKAQAETHHQMHQVSLTNLEHKHALELQENAQEHEAKVAKATAKENARVAGSMKTTKVTRKFANGGSHSKEITEPASKGSAASVTNKNRPANQHGKNLDPHKAKTSQDPDLLEVIHDEFEALLSELIATDRIADWNEESFKLCVQMLPGVDEQVVSARRSLFLKTCAPAGILQNADMLSYAIDTWAEDPLAKAA